MIRETRIRAALYLRFPETTNLREAQAEAREIRECQIWDRLRVVYNYLDIGPRRDKFDLLMEHARMRRFYVVVFRDLPDFIPAPTVQTIDILAEFASLEIRLCSLGSDYSTLRNDEREQVESLVSVFAEQNERFGNPRQAARKSTPGGGPQR